MYRDRDFSAVDVEPVPGHHEHSADGDESGPGNRGHSADGGESVPGVRGHSAAGVESVPGVRGHSADGGEPVHRDRDFTAVGKALATPARSVFLNLLMDGTSRPAGELARAAGVAASSASEHLTVLVEAGLVTCTARGRHRYYRLADAEVAAALEALGALAGPTPVAGYRRCREAEHLATARFCYDHLAGRLGMALADAWVEAGWLADRDALALTAEGAAGIRALGVEVDAAISARRATTRACLDWTERRPHLAGAVGAAVGQRFLQAGWVVRHRSGRGLTVTEAGHALLRERWDIRLPSGRH